MSTFHLQSTMRDVETLYPFSRSVLHAKFHVGGCATCGYEPGETIAQVAEKHGKDATAMVAALNEGVAGMQSSEITPARLKSLLEDKADVVLVDVREDWEHAICNLGDAAVLLNEASMEKVLVRAQSAEHVVFYCHHGVRSLNAALYFRENGLPKALSLRGGIDLYSREVAPHLPRY